VRVLIPLPDRDFDVTEVAVPFTRGSAAIASLRERIAATSSSSARSPAT